MTDGHEKLNQPEIDPDALAASSITAEEMAAQARQAIVADTRDLVLRRETEPVGVELDSRTFYFGVDTPTEESWEIRGEWVERDDAVEISTLIIQPSRTVVGSDGKRRQRPEGNTPKGGITRDLARRLGSPAPITRAIQAETNRQRDEIRTHIEEAEAAPAWLTNLYGSLNMKQSRPPNSRSEEWWVSKADEYLNAVREVGTFGATIQIWETRWMSEGPKKLSRSGAYARVATLRNRRLIERGDDGQDRLGRNHPRSRRN